MSITTSNILLIKLANNQKIQSEELFLPLKGDFEIDLPVEQSSPIASYFNSILFVIHIQFKPLKDFSLFLFKTSFVDVAKKLLTYTRKTPANQ